MSLINHRISFLSVLHFSQTLENWDEKEKGIIFACIQKNRGSSVATHGVNKNVIIKAIKDGA